MRRHLRLVAAGIAAAAIALILAASRAPFVEAQSTSVRPVIGKVQDNGTDKPARSKLNFIGATLADDPTHGRTNITLSASTVGAVPTSRTLTAGAGLTGGGTLASDRTFDVGAGDGITVNANDIAVNSTVVRTTGAQTVEGKTLTGVVDLTLSKNVAHTISIAANDDGSNGKDLILIGATGGAGQLGSNVYLQAGRGGTGGTGGNAYVRAGQGGASGGTAGDVILDCPSDALAGECGIDVGAGATVSGILFGHVPASDGDTTGRLYFDGRIATSLRFQTDLSTAAVDKAQTSTIGATGGGIDYTAGRGGNADASTNGGKGGKPRLVGPVGGDGSAARLAGQGGDVDVLGGAAGVNGGGGGNFGGSVNVRGGAGSGGVSAGAVNICDTSSSCFGIFLGHSTVSLSVDSPPTFSAPIAATASAWSITDPGNGGAISVAKNGVANLTSGGSGQTRTLAIPAFVGQEILLCHDTDGGGDIVITVASSFNSAGNTTVTFNDAGDCVLLKGRTQTGTRKWQLVVNDGATLG